MPSPSEPHQKGSLRNLDGDIARVQQFVGTWLGATAEDMQLDTAPASSPIRQASVRLTANDPGPWPGQRRGKVPYGPAGRMRLIAAEGIRSDIAQHVRPIECGGPAELCRFLAARTEALLIFWAVCHLSHSVPADKSRPTRPRLAPEFPASPF
jgi:hypothetical protein